MNRIIVFGATSAIAHAAARLWAARGASLCLVGRDLRKLQSVEDDLRVRMAPGAVLVSLQADLDRTADHPALVDRAAAALGGVDAVLVAQGTLPDQAACAASIDTTLAQLHTNGTAVVALCALLANRFETQGSGCIGVITSVAGDRGRQSNYTYGAAKGFVSRFLEGLRNRLAPSGIPVVDIRPGFVDTPMTAALPKKGPLWAQPGEIAAGIVQAMDRGRNVVYLPWFWAVIMAVVRSIPERVFKRMTM